MTALAHRFDQLVIKRLVGEEHRARDLHSRLGGLDRARRGKQQILDDIDLVAEIEQAQTRLQDADVGLASRDDHLLLLELGEMALDLRFLGQIEEVLLEACPEAGRKIAEALAKQFRQLSLEIERPLQRGHHRNLEVAEQPDQVRGAHLDAGTLPRLKLRQEEVLNVDNDAAALIEDNAFRHGCVPSTVRYPSHRMLVGLSGQRHVR